MWELVLVRTARMRALRLDECALLRREPIQLEYRVVCRRFISRDRAPQRADAVKARVEFPRQLFAERSRSNVAREPRLVSLKYGQQLGYRVLVVGREHARSLKVRGSSPDRPRKPVQESSALLSDALGLLM